MLEEDLMIAETSIVSLGGFLRPVSIHSKPIDGLIRELNAKGIDVLPENSRKEVSFRDIGGSFLVSFKSPTGFKEITKYVLRDRNGLSIEMSNFIDTESLPESSKAMSVTMGIMCKFTYEGTVDTGAREYIDRAKEVIKGFYPLPETQSSAAL